MNRILLLAAMLLPFVIHSQTGFNKVFNLPGMLSTTIMSIQIDQDTIVAFGNVIDVPYHYGVHLSKYDTMGNLLSHQIYFHPLGKPYNVFQWMRMTKTSDGGYLAVGDINLGDSMVIFKFSHTGELEWAKEISDNSLLVVYGFDPIECEGGYLIAGVLQYTDYNVEGCVFKITQQGNLIWRKDYGTAIRSEVALSMTKKDYNTFFVSGSQSNYLDINDPNQLARAWIIEIDSTGTLMSEWRSDPAENLSGGSIQLSGADDLVLTSNKLHYIPSLGTRLIEFVLRKINTNNWQTVWQTSQAGPESTYFGGWQSLAQNPVDSTWDIVGAFQQYGTGFVISGIIAHVDAEDGSTVWLRKDTGFVTPLLFINENYLHGIGHLSSGSLITGGWVFSTDDVGDVRQEAWLLKLSKDGCLEPDDCATVATHTPGTVRGPSFLNWEVFPNPSSTHTYLVPDKEMEGESGSVALFDQRGQQVREMAFTVQQGQPVRIDLQGLLPGVYTYQVQMKSGLLGSGKVMVMW